jgi:hypothetical protein
MADRMCLTPLGQLVVRQSGVVVTSALQVPVTSVNQSAVSVSRSDLDLRISRNKILPQLIHLPGDLSAGISGDDLLTVLLWTNKHHGLCHPFTLDVFILKISEMCNICSCGKNRLRSLIWPCCWRIDAHKQSSVQSVCGYIERNEITNQQ